MHTSVFRGAAGAAALLILVLAGGPEAKAFNYPKTLPNGKTCRVVMGATHWHVGDAADPSKDAAMAKAVQHWARFVVFEYGRTYGNWLAADKQAMKCAHDAAAGVWRCRAEAQPCKGE